MIQRNGNRIDWCHFLSVIPCHVIASIIICVSRLISDNYKSGSATRVTNCVPRITVSPHCPPIEPLHDYRRQIGSDKFAQCDRGIGNTPWTFSNTRIMKKPRQPVWKPLAYLIFLYLLVVLHVDLFFDSHVTAWGAKYGAKPFVIMLRNNDLLTVLEWGHDHCDNPTTVTLASFAWFVVTVPCSSKSTDVYVGPI